MTVESKMTEVERPASKVIWLGVYSHASGLSIPLRGLKMRLFNVFAFYKLGASLGPLRMVGVLEKDQALEVMMSAASQLHDLSQQKLTGLEILALPAAGIQVSIEDAMKGWDLSGGVNGEKEADIVKSLTEFETILEAQMPREYTYTIEQLRGFLMSVLVESAEQNLSPEVVKAISDEVKADIRQAGRCLAFEVPTAAGVHMMRAFEKVFRRYYNWFALEDAGHTDLATLIRRLRERSTAVDPKTLAVVDQIRSLHRNPLAHEVFLTMDEAVDLFDIAKSAITAMVREMR